MKRINTFPITTSVGFPFKSGSLEFLQLAHEENFVNTMRAMIGPSYDAAKFYRVWGCQITKLNATDYTIDGGVLFFDGKFLDIAQAPNFFQINTGAFPQIWLNIKLYTYAHYTFSADPVTMAGGGAPINLHDIIGLKFTSETGATADSVYFDSVIPQIYDIIGLHQYPVYSGTFQNHGTFPIDYRIKFNTVKLTGRVSNSVTNTNLTIDTPVFTLPVGYRPSVDKTFICPDLTITSKVSIVGITTAGVVSLRGDFKPCSNTGVVFDSISFDID